jgi:hypothetical protein
MSANQEMVCNKHFSTTNSYLKANGKTEIDWIFNNESLFNNASFLKRRNIRFFRLKRKSRFKVKLEVAEV